MKKIVYVSIDPVSASRRVINQINTALETGFSVEIITVKKDDIIPFAKNREVSINFIKQNFHSGILRFAEFNLKLLWILLFTKIDILICRGLWVFPAVIPLKIFKNFQIIYDAHEYFAGHTHFDNKPLKRKIWLSVEKTAMKIIDVLITVSEPIAEQYKKDYPHINKIYVIRNLPDKNQFAVTETASDKNKALTFNEQPKSVVFSGYLLPGRALPEIIRAFSYIDDKNIKLTIIGEGILKDELLKLREELNLTDKITFRPMVANEEIISALSGYDLGLSLIEADCLNRQFALPNKFFEYIAAGVPVLSSDIITQITYIEKYRVGKYISPDKPENITAAIMEMLNDEKQYNLWKQNCNKAAEELNWEQESIKLKKIYELF